MIEIKKNVRMTVIIFDDLKKNLKFKIKNIYVIYMLFKIF